MKISVFERNIPKISLFVFLVIYVFPGFSQSPVDGFYKGKGNYEAVIGGGFSNNGKYFAGTDKVSLTRNVSYVNLFLAAGITRNLDVYANIPFVKVNSESDFQDGSIFMKYRVLNENLVHGIFSASLALGYSDNLTDYQTEGGSAIGQQAQVVDIRPVLHYIRPSGWFYTLQGAYLWKAEPVPNAMNIAARVGRAGENAYFDFWYNFQHAFGGLDYRGDPAPDTFRELGVSYHRIGATYYRVLTSWFGAFIGSSYVLTGRNIGQGPGMSLGVVFKN